LHLFIFFIFCWEFNLDQIKFRSQNLDTTASKEFLYRNIPNKDEIVSLLQEAMQEYPKKSAA